MMIDLAITGELNCFLAGVVEKQSLVVTFRKKRHQKLFEKIAGSLYIADYRIVRFEKLTLFNKSLE